jgi:hypothetical protein
MTFHDALAKLETMANGKCNCEETNALGCPSCVARQELHGLHELVDHALEMIEQDYTPKPRNN